MRLALVFDWKRDCVLTATKSVESARRFHKTFELTRKGCFSVIYEAAEAQRLASATPSVL